MPRTLYAAVLTVLALGLLSAPALAKKAKAKKVSDAIPQTEAIAEQMEGLA